MKALAQCLAQPMVPAAYCPQGAQRVLSSPWSHRGFSERPCRPHGPSPASPHMSPQPWSLNSGVLLVHKYLLSPYLNHENELPCPCPPKPDRTRKGSADRVSVLTESLVGFQPRRSFIYLFIFKDCIYFQREGNGGRKRGRETWMCGCAPPIGDLAYVPPRHVP